MLIDNSGSGKLMIDWALMTLAFTSGLVAFFAPCSFVLLPGYITHYIGKKNAESKEERIIEGLKIGVLASIGFIILFGSAAIAILALGQAVKVLVPVIAIIAGLMLMAVGTMQLAGKDITTALPHFQIRAKDNISGPKQGIMFGMAYAIASLGCTFPLFMSVAIMALAAGSIFGGLLPIASYALGMSLLMISVTLIASASKKVMTKKYAGIIPHFRKISGAILALAGAYMIYWQWNLFFA